jgi:membrane protease YdiL (CAAX protease family)
LVVALLDRIRRQSVHHQTRPASSEPNAIQALAGNWAVILIAVVFFGLVMVLDLATSSRLVFFAFYIFPCVILTLALNWRWGTYAAVLAAATGSMIQSFDDPGGDLLFFIYWNALMRLVIYETVVILLERLRRQNILFVASKPD